MCETVLTSRLNWPTNFNEASSKGVIIDFSTNKLRSENDTTQIVLLTFINPIIQRKQAISRRTPVYNCSWSNNQNEHIPAAPPKWACNNWRLQMQTFTLVSVKTLFFLLQECIFFTPRLDILIFPLTGIFSCIFLCYRQYSTYISWEIVYRSSAWC